MKLPTFLGVACTLFISVPGEAANIVLRAGEELTDNQAALNAFQAAANAWGALIADDVTIYIDADIEALMNENDTPNTSTIGGADIYTYTEDVSDLNLDYDTVRNAYLAKDPGNTLWQALPENLQANVIDQPGAIVDLTTVGIVRANQRVLGLLDSSDTRSDGFIVFNSNFAFDYDNSNGIGAGLLDFQTVALHEIGHVLGFLSDVDEYDRAYRDGLIPLIFETNLTTLDLFRFAEDNAPEGLAEFSSFIREMTPGVASVLSDGTYYYDLSTGANLGDGNQASHWKDDYLVEGGTVTIGEYLGLMDPTLNDTLVPRTFLMADLHAFSWIGYDIVPEPQTALLLTGGLAMLATRRRRRIARL